MFGTLFLHLNRYTLPETTSLFFELVSLVSYIMEK